MCQSRRWRAAECDGYPLLTNVGMSRATMLLPYPDSHLFYRAPELVLSVVSRIQSVISYAFNLLLFTFFLLSPLLSTFLLRYKRLTRTRAIGRLRSKYNLKCSWLNFTSFIAHCKGVKSGMLTNTTSLPSSAQRRLLKPLSSKTLKQRPPPPFLVHPKTLLKQHRIFPSLTPVVLPVNF